MLSQIILSIFCSQYKVSTVSVMLEYTIIDFNEVDMRIYLPEKVISPRPLGRGEYHF